MACRQMDENWRQVLRHYIELCHQAMRQRSGPVYTPRCHLGLSWTTRVHFEFLNTVWGSVLQTTVNRLNNITRQYNLKISTSETKAVAFCGQNLTRCKLVIDNGIIEQIHRCD